MNKDKTRSSSRKSTVENSRRLETILQERDLKKQKKKSKNLATVIEKELDNLSQEAQDLSNLADNIENESSLVSQSSSTLETAVVDPLGALTPASRKRSVSTEVNRFECGNTSSLSPERAGFIILEPNLNENLSTINEVFEENKMDENDYKSKLKQAKLYKRQFTTLLSTFTADNVTSIVHKNLYETKLHNIGAKFIEISNWFDSLIVDLEENDENDRKAVIEAIQTEIKLANQNNEKLILDKISDLVSCQSGSVGSSPSVTDRSDSEPINHSYARKLEESKAKAGIKKSFIEEKVKSLKQKVRSFKAPVEMTNDEVCYALKESKTWERKFEEIVNEQQKYYEECVPFDDLEDAKEQVRQEIESLQDTITDKISLLAVEDESRGLSCRAENKSKDTVVFPSVFKGELGENVFKFVEEIKNAIIDSQVKKSDQVKTLLKYLGGEAKKRCGDHYTDLESALKALKEFYGNASLIWLKTRNEFESAFTNLHKEWGEYGDPARVTAIARVIEFLRQSDHLATEYTELSSEVYSSSTAFTFA